MRLGIMLDIVWNTIMLANKKRKLPTHADLNTIKLGYVSLELQTMQPLQPFKSFHIYSGYPLKFRIPLVYSESINWELVLWRSQLSLVWFFFSMCKGTHLIIATETCSSCKKQSQENDRDINALMKVNEMVFNGGAVQETEATSLTNIMQSRPLGRTSSTSITAVLELVQMRRFTCNSSNAFKNERL